jgi:hypothetical protein
VVVVLGITKASARKLRPGALFRIDAPQGLVHHHGIIGGFVLFVEKDNDALDRKMAKLSGKSNGVHP